LFEDLRLEVFCPFPGTVAALVSIMQLIITQQKVAYWYGVQMCDATMLAYIQFKPVGNFRYVFV